MTDKENKRKCFKCGCSPAEDNVKLFRFPKPAVRNLVRCELWAKFMFPEREYCSIELQQKLHSEHRMLCQQHFRDEDFMDNSRAKLLRTAVPFDTDHNLKIYCNESQPGPSQQVGLNEVNEPQPGPSRPVALNEVNNPPRGSHRVALSEINEPQPGSSHRVSLSEVNDLQPAPKHQNTAVPKTSEKEEVLRAKCSLYMKKICQLRYRIKNLKSKQMLDTLHDDKYVQKLAKKITPAFALLLQGQIRNFKRKLKGRRWSKEEKITALRIYKRSPTCYRLLRRLFPLPAPGTLRTLLSRIPFSVGLNKPIFKIFKKFVETQKDSENFYTLLFDEMSLKKHLNYNSKDDVIEGYQDHGTQGKSEQVAGYALVFMITGIRRKLKQPIAHYFSSGFVTADRLAVLIKEVVKECFDAGINIAATVCDMDEVNRRALSILGATLDHPHITLYNKEVVTLFDTPHLLKCFRNNFMAYDIECSTDISSGINTGRGIAKWAHIKEFYELDNTNMNFVFAPALKKTHLCPNNQQKMKVSLAAQVLSHSVAAGMFAKIADGSLSANATVTANIISNMDKLFDALNSDSSDLRRGKPFSTNMTATSPHREHFVKMKKFFETLKFVGSVRKPPSQNGWIWTINGMERLWRNLGAKSLATRRVQQDPLENLFGCVRGNCGSNARPTSGQFVAGLKTAVLSGLSHIGTTGNCETDSNSIINNFNTMLTAENPTRIRTDKAESELVSLNELITFEIEEALQENTSEIQACAYVCGFIVKKLPTHCEICKSTLTSQEIENHHLFVECKEYSETKKSLAYVTKDLVACVEHCSYIIISFLKEKAHETLLRKTVSEIIKETVNFDFIVCPLHKEAMINTIILSVFLILVRRFCILKNREFAEIYSENALKRKMNKILHK